MTKTYEECKATEMLLGMWYDESDHTFNKQIGEGIRVLDADTLEELCPDTSTTSYIDLSNERQRKVFIGEIGFRYDKDTQMPIHREDGTG